MKENVPEKIYLNPLLMEDGESIVRRCTFERQRDGQIEYIRTDAIIEKVEKFMKTVNEYLYHCVSEECDYVDTDKFIEGFKNYMTGE